MDGNEELTSRLFNKDYMWKPTYKTLLVFFSNSGKSDRNILMT